MKTDDYESYHEIYHQTTCEYYILQHFVKYHLGDLMSMETLKRLNHHFCRPDSGKQDIYAKRESL